MLFQHTQISLSKTNGQIKFGHRSQTIFETNECRYASSRQNVNQYTSWPALSCHNIKYLCNTSYNAMQNFQSNIKTKRIFLKKLNIIPYARIIFAAKFCKLSSACSISSNASAPTHQAVTTQSETDLFQGSSLLLQYNNWVYPY